MLPPWEESQCDSGVLYIFFFFFCAFMLPAQAFYFWDESLFLKMPASGVPNYLTAHRHYETAHRRRQLACWALDRNQGAPHGEAKKEKEKKNMWQFPPNSSAACSLFKSADNRASFALCSFCAPPLLMHKWKVKDCRFIRDSELAPSLKQASVQEIIQH